MRTGSGGRVCSTTTSAVMIFVRLAIGSTRSGSWRQSTSPLSRSNTSPARGGLRSPRWKASTAPRSTSGTGSASTIASGSVGAGVEARTGGVCMAIGSPLAPLAAVIARERQVGGARHGQWGEQHRARREPARTTRAPPTHPAGA